MLTVQLVFPPCSPPVALPGQGKQEVFHKQVTKVLQTAASVESGNGDALQKNKPYVPVDHSYVFLGELLV